MRQPPSSPAMAFDHLSDIFPPQPDHEHEWIALEGILAGVVDGRNADYVSTPLTTGPRFMDWYHAEGSKLKKGSSEYERELQRHVITRNSLRARQFVDQLRADRRVVIEPTSLSVSHWTQNDYRHLWGRVIERYARCVWLLDGWQYSSGCAYEFWVAKRVGIETLSEAGRLITREEGVSMIEAAIRDIEAISQSPKFLRAVATALLQVQYQSAAASFKDEALDRLARTANVAQFVSFAPGSHPSQRYCRILGAPANHRFPTLEEAIDAVLRNSSEGSVNVRSFRPADPGSYPFVFGLKTVGDAAARVRQMAAEGLNTIVNETIDIHDGGVSGVLMDRLTTFAPDDTPRCVEKEGTASLRVDIAETLLESVYGFTPRLKFEPTLRVEFSIHPRRRGVQNEHTIIWEIGHVDEEWERANGDGRLSVGTWPNRFSRLLGDKVYGLLIAHALGFAVPRTHVVNRRVAPFSFGRRSGTGEVWIRTAPEDNSPGQYVTSFGWQDPFRVMNESSEIDGPPLAAILGQESVESVWSGSVITESNGPRVEGVRGFGDRFMMNAQSAEHVPESVCAGVVSVHRRLCEALGPVSVEWAYDGETVWILQLHQELSLGGGSVIFPGEADVWIEVDPRKGLEYLRGIADRASRERKGVELTHSIATTSHGAAIFRKRRVPTRIRASAA